MLIAIERSQFNYLFKLNSISVDLNRIYFGGKKQLLSNQQNSIEKAMVELDEVLPSFEEDHEIILLEYDHKIWEYNEYQQLEFQGVISVIPLTQVGQRLLTGKLNNKIKMSSPVFEETVEGVKNKRSLKLRRLAAEKLLNIFHLDHPPTIAVTLMEKAISQLSKNSQKITSQENVFQTLFAYNTTEGFIPEGNIGYLCKIAVLARLHLGQEPSLVQQGPFYKELLKHSTLLNRLELIDAFKEFTSISLDSTTSTQKIKEVLNKDWEVDIFFVAYMFFAFRQMLNKSDNNLHIIKNEIEKLRIDNKVVASIVMYAIGTVFSFEQLYESIHELNSAPLLTNSFQGKASLYKESKKPEEVSAEKSRITPREFVERKSENQSIVKEDAPVQFKKVEIPESKTAESKTLTDYKVETKENVSIVEKGIPVSLFREFAQKELPKKGKEFLILIDGYGLELQKGISFSWLNDKLSLDDAANLKKKKISKKSVDLIKSFFQNNKVRDAK